MQAIPTLYFQGVSDDALRFYLDVLGPFGATILFHHRVADLVPPQQVRPGTGDRTLRAALRIGDTTVYLADAHRPGGGFDGFSMTLCADTPADAARLLDALADGGAIQLALMQTAWAQAYGTVRDRFGVHWTIEAGLHHSARS